MQELSPQKPEWLKVKLPRGGRYAEMREHLAGLGLNTVCASARCPNAFECWGAGCCTFLVLGTTCTRACRFCAVDHGRAGDPVDPAEAERIAAAAKELGLDYVVITSVDRDDLADGGAGHIADCIRTVRREFPRARVEAIVPDFGGKGGPLRTVIDAGPDVLAHNVEVVERLTPLVRDRRASYRQSLGVLREMKRLSPATITKTSLMLGIGEEPDEARATIRDVRDAGVDVLTLGQYLRPGRSSLPVARYVPPEEFDQLAGFARSLGFRYVASGPLVRSSYHAAAHYAHLSTGMEV